MKKLILIILVFHLCFSETTKIWKLDVKAINEEEDEEVEIELIPGRYTKVFFVLSNIDKDYDIFKVDESSYKLSIEDENIVSLNNDIILTPKVNLVYSTYIGLPCQHSINEENNTYIINLSITPNNNLTDANSIEYSNLSVNINREKTEISLSFALYSVINKGLFYFQLENELYNVDEISVMFDEIIDGVEFSNITFKPFGQREIFLSENPENHGYLFDFPMGITKEYSEFNEEETYIKSNFSIINDALTECFYPGRPISFAVFNQNETFKEEEEKKIIHNFEYLTQKFDKTNNIQFNTELSTEYYIIKCEFETISEKSLLKNSKKKIYRNYFSSKQANINIGGLAFNEEYKANCEFSEVLYNEADRKAINITIGNNNNNKTYDIDQQLKSSKDGKRIPICNKISFKNNNLNDFKKNGELICKYYMKKNEPLKVRDLPTVICEIIVENEENATICVSPHPESNLDEIINDEKLFGNILNEFIGKVENYYKAQSIGKKEYDQEIDPNLISANLLRIEDNQQKFIFDFLSVYNQEIKCYYNSKLTNENNKFLNMDNFIILYPNKKESREIGIISNISNMTIYSLNLKCYNLPYFNYKYEETVKIVYSYLYINLSKEIDQMKVNNHTNISINCYEKGNQANPICLKNNIIQITELFKTPIPGFVKEIDIKLHQFSELSEEAKTFYVDDLFNKLNDESKKKNQTIQQYYEKSIEYLKFLSLLDCSQYFPVKTNNVNPTINKEKYDNCRKKKKESIKTIFDLTNYSSKNTSSINDILVRLGTNLEDNLKYVLIFINELSNNPESYDEDNSNIIIKNALILQQNFSDYWNLIEEYLGDSSEYQKSVKRDVLYAILEILTSIPKIIHFNEIDGYLENENIKKTKSGLILYDKAIDIHNGILDISKHFSVFNKKNYKLSGISFLDVDISDNNEPETILIRTSFVINEDIKVELGSNYLRGTYDAAIHVLVFDSPLVSIKPLNDSNEFSDTLNPFISIRLFTYDYAIEEYVEIDKITIERKRLRPFIIYNQKKIKNIKGCYFYNETSNLLENAELDLEEYNVFTDKYYRCSSKNLGLFTAGTNKISDGIIIKKEEEKNEQKEIKNILDFPEWQLILILLGIVFVLTALIYILMNCKIKRKITSNNIDIKNDKNDKIENLMDEELD